MFDPLVLSELAEKHAKTFRDLRAIEEELNRRFYDMEEAVHGLILSVAGGEPLLLVGPPGTAKSLLIRRFCEKIGLSMDISSDDYFEYTLTPFTEPGELFGFYDIANIRKGGELKRLDKGMMQKARVVYLDEVFKGSSAILNSLLTFINEKRFHDRGQCVKVNMKCLFAATNELPDSPELQAMFDRFLLRCRLENVRVRSADAGSEPVHDMLKTSWRETYREEKSGEIYTALLDDLDRFHRDVTDLTRQKKLVPNLDSWENKRCYYLLLERIQTAREYELSDMSNRRLVKLSRLMLVKWVYDRVWQGEKKKNRIGTDELSLLHRYFLDRVDEQILWQMAEETD